MIYFAFIHSQLAYDIEIYGNTYPTHLNNLAVFNNKILRILQCAAWDSHVVNLYTNFSTVTLDNLHKFTILLFFYKFFPPSWPITSYFLIIFCNKNSDLHSRDTRSKDKPHFQFTTSLAQRSIYGVLYSISLNQSHLTGCLNSSKKYLL